MDYVRKIVLYREVGVREYRIADPNHDRNPIIRNFSVIIACHVFANFQYGISRSSAI